MPPRARAPCEPYAYTGNIVCCKLRFLRNEFIQDLIIFLFFLCMTSASAARASSFYAAARIYASSKTFVTCSTHVPDLLFQVLRQKRDRKLLGNAVWHGVSPRCLWGCCGCYDLHTNAFFSAIHLPQVSMHVLASRGDYVNWRKLTKY